MEGLQGFRALIAGGATGIGAVTCRSLADAGAKVAIGDINIADAEKVAEDIRSAGGTAIAIHFDLSQEDSIKILLSHAVEFLGGLDGLVNMAADLSAETLLQDNGVDAMSAAVWPRTLEVDLIGYALATKYVLPHLLAAGGGSIVNISSASVASQNPPHPAYAAAKAGVQVWTKHTAVNWGGKKARANSVAFGPIATGPMLEAVKDPKVKAMVEEVPLQRMGEPREAAAVVLYLLSSHSSYVTGQVWQVNGGVVCRD